MHVLVMIIGSTITSIVIEKSWPIGMVTHKISHLDEPPERYILAQTTAPALRLDMQAV